MNYITNWYLQITNWGRRNNFQYKCFQFKTHGTNTYRKQCIMLEESKEVPVTICHVYFIYCVTWPSNGSANRNTIRTAKLVSKQEVSL